MTSRAFQKTNLWIRWLLPTQARLLQLPTTALRNSKESFTPRSFSSPPQVRLNHTHPSAWSKNTGQWSQKPSFPFVPNYTSRRIYSSRPLAVRNKDQRNPLPESPKQVSPNIALILRIHSAEKLLQGKNKRRDQELEVLRRKIGRLDLILMQIRSDLEGRMTMHERKWRKYVLDTAEEQDEEETRKEGHWLVRLPPWLL